MPETLLNWAGNLTYRAARIHRPASVEEVQSIVAGASKVRALGSRHSFNHIADTTEDLVSMERLNRVLSFDAERSQVTVQGGIRYGDLARFLRPKGAALHNLGSLPHISVAGAVATGTHGSGVANGNLATAVAAIEFVRADGELVRLSRAENPESFPGAVISLGGLGPVVSVTLDVLPNFEVGQTVYEGLPFDVLAERFEEIEAHAYSVSLFTHWKPADQAERVIEQVWLKRRVADGGEWPEEIHGARRSTRRLHPIAHMSPENCTEQFGIPGPWDERLPHFRLEFTPSAGEEIQSEYILPRKNAWAALSALDGLRDRIAPLLQISEIRTVAADDLWLSPSYGQDGVCLHFTWAKLPQEVEAVLPHLEAALEPFEARPHWGKVFTMPPAKVRSLYPRMPDFERLISEHDPAGKFRNLYLDELLGA